MTGTLSFEYEYSRDDDDDFGKLTAEVRTPSFSGRNRMWVQWQDVVDLAAALATFPIEADDPVTAEWGFGGSDPSQAVTTTITKVSIAPQGRTGGLIVRVALTDQHDASDRCSTHFTTDYPSIERFGDEITIMMRDRTGRAVLHGRVDDR